MSDHHNALIKTPRQLITVVILAFVVPVVVIILLATYVAGDRTGGAGSDAMTPEAIADRLRPIGTVALQQTGGATTLQSGEAVYKAACAACHTTGAAGAPKIGDGGAWAPRLKQGFETLVKHAVQGFKAMPPKGGNTALDSIEVARAVAYIGNQSGAKFKEPEAPATSTAAAPAARSGGSPSAPAASASAPPAVIPPPAAIAAASAGAKPDGAKIYASGCSVCHAAGVAGAPKLGDKAGWAARASQGVNALTASVIKGKGAMPPKGGVANASEAELRAAVEHMLAASK